MQILTLRGVYYKKSWCIFPCFKGALFTFHIITIPPGSWGQEENVKGPKDWRKNQKKEHRNEIIGEIGTKGKTGTIVLQNSITKKHIFCRLKPRKSDFQNPPSKSQSMQIRVSFGILLYFLSLHLLSIIYFYISAACVFYLN